MFCKVCLFASISAGGGIIDLGLKHGHPWATSSALPTGPHLPLPCCVRSYHVIVGQLHSIAGTHLTRWGLLVAAGANLPPWLGGLNCQVFTPSCSFTATLNQWPMGVGKCPGSLTLSSVILRCVFFTGSWIFLCCGVKLQLLVGVTCLRTPPLVSAFFPCFRSPPPTAVFSHSPIRGSTCPWIPFSNSASEGLQTMTTVSCDGHFRSPWSYLLFSTL